MLALSWEGNTYTNLLLVQYDHDCNFWLQKVVVHLNPSADFWMLALSWEGNTYTNLLLVYYDHDCNF